MESIKKIKENITKIIFNFIQFFELIVSVIIAIVAIFMLFNISVSSLAAIRQDERNREIAATSNIDMFFDKYYSDEVMDVIYENKIEVKR